MIKKLLFVYCITILFSGCSSPKIITTWKAHHTILPVHNKIMVAGIIKANTDSVRMKIEDGLVKNLTELGYNAVSALREFGPKGLSDLSQEATYIKLCNQGIDAVMTIALIDKFKQTRYEPGKLPGNTSYYYYSHIWNYQKIRAELSEAGSALHTRYIWESILFDLSTLEPLCVVETRSFSPGKELKAGYIQQILDKMKKEKILVKQNIKRDKKPF